MSTDDTSYPSLFILLYTLPVFLKSTVTQASSLPEKGHLPMLLSFLELAHLLSVVLVDPHPDAVSFVLEPGTLVLLTAKSRDTLTASHVVLVELADVLPPLVDDFFAYPAL